MQFNLLIFEIHEIRPEDFLETFIQNGYKISLNGFINSQFISIEYLMRTNFITTNLYLV